jgi:hypothetical protein
MKLIYAGRRPFKTAREAAREVARISGEDTEVWQITRALLWETGFVNGIPVFAREAPDPEEAAGEEAEPEQPRRARLLRIEEVYEGGIPPRWR